MSLRGGCDACGVELPALRSYLALPTEIADSPVQRVRRLVVVEELRLD
jgi:hypothetical protein